MVARELVLTLSTERLIAAVGGDRVDIRELIRGVPTATVVSGDPACSLKVRVSESYVDRLSDAVRDVCDVDEDVKLQLY